MIATNSKQQTAAATTTACAHCGEPSPPTDVGPAFCCDGCRGAYAIIHEWELEDYYALRDQLGGQSSRPQRESDKLALLDRDDLLEGALTDLGDGHRSVTLAVDGLHCAACAWLVERSVPLIDGWKSARVNLPQRAVEIVFDPKATRLSTIARTLSAFGYQLRPRAEQQTDSDPTRGSRLRGIAIAGFCFANAMWIAIALYAGADGIHGQYLNLFATALAAIAVFGPGQVFLRSAWASLRTRTPHIDLPVSIGLIAGLIGAVSSTLTGSGDSYADSICGLVFFLLIGRELQARGQHRANEAVRALASLSPPLAQRAIGETVETVRAADLLPDDIVEVGPGETVPVDGELIDGHAVLDQAVLTGESRPVQAEIGHSVAAGAINLQSRIRVRAQATAGQTRVASIARMVEQSLVTRTPLVQKADQVGGVFVIAVLIAAAVTFALAIQTAGVGEAAHRAIALLVVACPCALALATPLAIGVAVGRAAQRGLLVRRGDVFERLRKPGTVWLDKTGTLTEGRPTIVDWHGDNDSLQLAASIEQDSLHPVGRSLVEAASRKGLASLNASNVEHHRLGVCGIVDGQHVIVGTGDFLAQLGIQLPPATRIQADVFAADGKAPNFVAIDRNVQAVFSVGDRIRSEAASTIDTFRAAGWNVGILSGDHADVVANVAAQLGVCRSRALGGLSPEQKLGIVKESAQNDASVAFVGDGVNDAAALAAADVGIATSGAAEASLQAAAVYSAGPLGDLSDLLTASERTVSTIHRLLAVSLLYNIAAGTAAMLGWITPLGAAVLMPISSLTVTALAFAGRTFPQLDQTTHIAPPTTGETESTP